MAHGFAQIGRTYCSVPDHSDAVSAALAFATQDVATRQPAGGSHGTSRVLNDCRGGPLITVSASGPALLIALLLFLLVMVAVGLLTGRLLGVHRGIWRSFVAGGVGFAVFLALMSWRPDSSLPVGIGWVLVIVVMVMATMATSVLLDALLKPGRPGSKRGLGAALRGVRGYLPVAGSAVRDRSLRTLTRAARHSGDRRAPEPCARPWRTPAGCWSNSARSLPLVTISCRLP